MSPALCSTPAATDTPGRRTPSIIAMNSWVMGNSSIPARSWAISSQRERRCSMAWRALHAAPIVTPAQEAEGQADQPLRADHADLDLLAAFQRGQERAHAALGEQHGFHHAVSGVEGLVEGEFDRLQPGAEP